MYYTIMTSFLDTEARDDCEVDGEEGYLSEDVPIQVGVVRGRPSRSRLLDSDSDLDDGEIGDELGVGLLGVSKRKRFVPTARNDHDLSNRDILKELKKTNTMMMELVRKVKRTEQRMKAMEEKIIMSEGPSSSSNSTPKRLLRKRVVPDAVRVSIL